MALALLASRCWRSRAKVGGGSSTCFAWLMLLVAEGQVGGGGSSTFIAGLMLISVGRVLGVVQWRGDWRQFYGIGGGALALGWWLLHAARWAHWQGGVVGALVVGHWRGSGIVTTALMLEGEGPHNQHEVEGGRGEGRINHVTGLGGGGGGWINCN